MLSREEREIKHLKAKVVRKDAIITQLEAENDALGAKLHEIYTGEPCTTGKPYAFKDRLWRRYVNGGSRIWRLLFEVCDSGGRLWQAVRRVAVKKHE